MTTAISSLGLGTAGFSKRLGSRAACAIVDAALAEGITHIDTAPMYGLGAAEELLGRCLRGRRDRFTIATKVGISPPRAAAARLLPGRLLRGPLGSRFDWDLKVLERSFERSLRHLETDHVDMLLLHEVPAGLVDESLIEFADRRVRDGKARTTGIATGVADTVVIAGTWAPFPAMAQVPLTRGVTPPPNVKLILHSVVRPALERAAAADSELWKRRLGVDVNRAEVVAGLALALALRDHPQATVLFSSRSPQRLGADARLAREYLQDAELLERYAALTSASTSR